MSVLEHVVRLELPEVETDEDAAVDQSTSLSSSVPQQAATSKPVSIPLPSDEDIYENIYESLSI